MQRQLWHGLAWAGLILVACNLSVSRTPAPTAVSPAPGQGVTPTVVSLPTPLKTPAYPVLETDTGPYANQVHLLDGVCFEFLMTLNGQAWAWQSAGELAAFYDRVDASRLCPGVIRRAAYPFEGTVLAGTVAVTTGCDAAHRVLNLARDNAARTVTLLLVLEVLPGCPYELVEPFLIALPRLPAGYTLQIVITPP